MSQQGKKLINNAKNVVQESLLGLVQTHSHLRLLRKASSSSKGDSTTTTTSNVFQVVVRKDIDMIKQQQVTLVSGGGSGHEPSHVGYIGEGMLSAAICGSVYTSPDVSSILSTIRACTVPVTSTTDKNVGLLFIVKNYTGDRLNFGLAIELARKEGYNVDMVVVGDDCALNELNPEKNFELRRGIAGTVFVHKLVGAYAARKHSLTEVKKFAVAVSRLVSTIGVALTPCVLPGSKDAGFQLPENKMELGLGIHGEPGVQQTDLLSANETVDQLLKYIDSDKTEYNQKTDSVALMVNNLGSTTGLELYIVASRAIQTLEQQYNVTVERVYVGPFMTALEMGGVSLTVLSLPSDKKGELLNFLDVTTGAIAWPLETSKTIGSRLSQENTYLDFTESDTRVTTTEKAYPVSDKVIEIVAALCKKSIEQEEEFSNLDSKVGDGDMGQSFRRGAELVLEAIHSDANAKESVSDLLHTIALAVRMMGGSSGVLLSIFFLRMATVFEKEQSDKTVLQLWVNALGNGIQGISEFGGAKKGDRTMLDTLIPVHEFLSNQTTLDDTVKQQLIEHAFNASEATKQLEGKKGRSGYLKTRVIGNVDPGAYAMATLIETLVKQL
jgi:dihydroxyacetone kinase